MTEKATIYHNPRCSKSRAAVQLLQQHEIDVTTPTSATINFWTLCWKTRHW